jgi:hypothetical protein
VPDPDLLEHADQDIDNWLSHFPFLIGIFADSPPGWRPAVSVIFLHLRAKPLAAATSGVAF